MKVIFYCARKQRFEQNFFDSLYAKKERQDGREYEIYVNHYKPESTLMFFLIIQQLMNKLIEPLMLLILKSLGTLINISNNYV